MVFKNIKNYSYILYFILWLHYNTYIYIIVLINYLSWFSSNVKNQNKLLTILFWAYRNQPTCLHWSYIYKSLAVKFFPSFHSVVVSYTESLYLSIVHLQNTISQGELGHCDRSTLIRCGFMGASRKQFISSLKKNDTGVG